MKYTTHDYDVLIGKKIKLLREEKNLSQTTIGEQIGVSRQAICQYEKAQRSISISQLKNLCKILGTNIVEFLESLDD